MGGCAAGAVCACGDVGLVAAGVGDGGELM